MGAKEIFLSASVPSRDSGEFFDSADPFLIQLAVRELVIATIRTHNLVWGGHPAITPMIAEVCKDLKVNVKEKIFLYQSAFFQEIFPQENEDFANVIITDPVANDRDKSLIKMRTMMLSRRSFSAAVFIGGMKGIFEEFEMFKDLNPNSQVIAVAGPGGAASMLADRLGSERTDPDDLDFARLFSRRL